MSATHAAVQRWWRDGRPEPRPEPVRAHLDGCAACRGRLAEADEVRGWLAAPPPPLPAERLAAIRFRLEAEARVPAPAAAPRRARRMAVAAALAAALAVAALLSRGDRAPPVPRVDVDPEGAAQLSRLTGVGHEVYVLAEGMAWFTVAPRAGAPAVRVLAGADVIEVRGTRFRLAAAGGRLRSVEVAAGAVAIALAEGRLHTLGPGERWRRVEDPPRVAPPLAVAAATVAPAPPAPPRRTHPPGPAPRAAPAPIPEPPPAPPSIDMRFHAAWQLVRAGRHAAAAAALDDLLAAAGASPRRADILYWSARSHAAAGERAVARARLEELVRDHPGSWHRADAEKLISLLNRD